MPDATSAKDGTKSVPSILARNEFVTRLGTLEKQFEMRLPKGASAAVDAAAKPPTKRSVSKSKGKGKRSASKSKTKSKSPAAGKMKTVKSKTRVTPMLR